jgi:hypothetical protein
MEAATKMVTDWSNIDNTIDLLESEGRALTSAEKRVLEGQRKINGILFETLSAILDTFPEHGAPPAIARAREMFWDLPGQEPPGCSTTPPPPPGGGSSGQEGGN